MQMFGLSLPKRNCRRRYGLREKPQHRAKAQRVLGLFGSKWLLSISAVTQLPAWWLEVVLCSMFACFIEESGLSPLISPLCACVCACTCVRLNCWKRCWQMAWCGAVSNSIIYGDKSYMCQQQGGKKIDKILEKLSKMGKFSCVAWHRLLHGSVMARGDLCITLDQAVQSWWQSKKEIPLEIAVWIWDHLLPLLGSRKSNKHWMSMKDWARFRLDCHSCPSIFLGFRER